MASFIDLEDSPMFHKQVSSLEQTTDELKDRCQSLFKGCQKFLASLSEAYDGDTTFADALELFGGQEDPLSLSIGGPLISRFIGAFRELATYKDLLRLQCMEFGSSREMEDTYTTSQALPTASPPPKPWE